MIVSPLSSAQPWKERTELKINQVRVTISLVKGKKSPPNYPFPQKVLGHIRNPWVPLETLLSQLLHELESIIGPHFTDNETEHQIGQSICMERKQQSRKWIRGSGLSLH